jgi:hypothetical protein
MLQRLREGIRAGRTEDDLAKTMDLSHHKMGRDRQRNEVSVRAVYKKVAKQGH